MSILSQAAKEAGRAVSSGEAIVFRDLSREDLMVLYGTAQALYNAGDYDDAEKVFRQLTVCKPLEENHWHGLGATLQMKKAYKEALTAWSMAALMGQDNPLPHFHAAECLFSIGETSEALKALSEARKYLDHENADHQTMGNQIDALEKIWQTA